ncbi:RNA-directed DNA polymerase, eukaryota, partial [Tanacetum coccineum]
ELLDVEQGVPSVIVGNVIAIQEDEGWWYLRCRTCRTKVIKSTDYIDLEFEVPKKAPDGSNDWWCRKCQAWVSLIKSHFWNDLWIGNSMLKLSFLRLFTLEENKVISVADKLHSSISSSFRRPVRGGEEAQQPDQLSVILDSVSLSNMDDRWYWDLNGDGVFLVKDVRSLLDEVFLSKMDTPTRWIKCIPIKVNVFVWKLSLDRLPTRSNLLSRNILVSDVACPLCDHELEDSSHLFFGCPIAKDVQKLVCRWWNLDVQPYESYDGWLS